MFKIKISNIKEADYIYKGWATHAVSLVDPDMRYTFTNDRWTKFGHPNPNHLVCYFDDVGKLKNIPHCEIPPSEQIVRNVLTFTQNLPEDARLLVHCHAGVSRSPAMAIAIAIQAGMSPQEAIKYIHEIRPQMCPNAILIKYTDNVLGLNNELCRAMDAWAHSDGHVWDSYLI